MHTDQQWKMNAARFSLLFFRRRKRLVVYVRARNAQDVHLSARLKLISPLRAVLNLSKSTRIKRRRFSQQKLVRNSLCSKAFKPMHIMLLC